VVYVSSVQRVRRSVLSKACIRRVFGVCSCSGAATADACSQCRVVPPPSSSAVARVPLYVLMKLQLVVTLIIIRSELGRSGCGFVASEPLAPAPTAGPLLGNAECGHPACTQLLVEAPTLKHPKRQQVT
jgi:hypothetical protein